MGPLHLEHTLDWPIMVVPRRELTPCGMRPSLVLCVGVGCVALPLLPQHLPIDQTPMNNISLLARVYLAHPREVGLPTNKRDLYYPPPLMRTEVIEFSRKWGRPLKTVPPQWGRAISPILVGIHLEVEGTTPKGRHDDALVQYMLWQGGDRVLMWHILMARLRPMEIPRRTFYWYLERYDLQLKDIHKVSMMHPTAKGSWTWTVPLIREVLQGVDTLTLEWYRLSYLVGR